MPTKMLIQAEYENIHFSVGNAYKATKESLSYREKKTPLQDLVKLAVHAAMYKGNYGVYMDVLIIYFKLHAIYMISHEEIQTSELC